MTTYLMAAEEANPLVPSAWEMLITAVGFFLLLFISIKWIVPMFERTYAERRDAIEGGLARAEKAQAEAERARDEYNQQLESARLEAQQIREDARVEGQRILADFKERANVESARITEKAHMSIAAERSAGQASLRNEVGVLAVQLSSKVVGESLADDDRSRRVIDRFIADLENDANSEGARQ